MAFATALAATLLAITLSACGTKGALTLPLPPPRPQAMPATPVGNVNTEDKAKVSHQVNTPPHTTEERIL